MKRYCLGTLLFGGDRDKLPEDPGGTFCFYEDIAPLEQCILMLQEENSRLKARIQVLHAFKGGGDETIKAGD